MKYLILGMLVMLVIAAACKGTETKPDQTGNTGNGQNQPETQPDTEINSTNVDDNSTQAIDEDISDAVDEINNW